MPQYSEYYQLLQYNNIHVPTASIIKLILEQNVITKELPMEAQPMG